MQTTRRETNWSKLPVELLRSIAQILTKNTNDFTNFRAVCKNWRRSTSISVLLPFSDYSTPSFNLFSSSVLLLRHGRANSTTTLWMVSAVEITKGNIQLCHPFFHTTLVNLLDDLDTSQLHSSLVSESYHVAFINDRNCSSALSGIDKTLLFSTRLLPCINDCILLVLHNGRLGGYPCFDDVHDDEPQWVDVSYHGVDDFDDIVNFRGVVYAVDWEGKLYEMASDEVAVRKTLVSAPVSRAGAYKGWRKRLVGSLFDEKLYLIVRGREDVLKVYKLSKYGKIWIWIDVQSFEDGDQVLFMSRVYGFFAAARDFPGRQLSNSIVFSDDAFPVYSFRGWVYHVDAKAEEDIRIFRVGASNDYSNFRPVLSDPNFPIMLWSPPSWILEGHTSRTSSHSNQRRNSECEEMQIDQEQPAVTPSTNSTVTQEDPIVESFETNSVTPPHQVVQRVVEEVTTLKFQGVNVQSDHLPILQKVWLKHGDIVNASNIRSCDILSAALASLAKMILILQTNTGKTLTDNQAHYMASTLSDVQSMRIKVDWLVPSVEKAVALHKRKPLEAALAELEKAKAKVEEINRKFLEEMAEMKQGFNPDKAKVVSKSMSASAYIDQDTCLGEGLL